MFSTNSKPATMKKIDSTPMKTGIEGNTFLAKSGGKITY